MGSSQSRKERRAYELYLKKHNKEEYKKWKAGVSERGKLYHQEATEKSQAKQLEFLEEKQRSIIQDLKSKGWTDEKIDQYMETWVESINSSR